MSVTILYSLVDPGSSSSEVQWCFSQVKGTLDDDVTEADIISCVEFNQDGDAGGAMAGKPNARACLSCNPGFECGSLVLNSKFKT